MSSKHKLSELRPYAKAFWSISQEDTINDWKPWLDSLRQIVDLPVVQALLVSPKANTPEMMDLIISVLPKMTKLQKKSLEVLIANQRLLSVESIFYLYRDIENANHKITRAEIETANSLSDDVLASIEKKLSQYKASKVLCEQKINPALVMGMVIKMDSQVFDFSMDGQLRHLLQ